MTNEKKEIFMIEKFLAAVDVGFINILILN